MRTIISTAASLGAFMLVSACATAPEVAVDPVPLDAAFPPALVELNFESHGDRLNGHAYLAEGEGPHPTVVLLHGFPGNERNLDLAQDLRSDGFNVLFFHYRGAWGSEGTYSFTHVIEDVAAATDMLRANTETYRADPDKLILIGHSMGGFAALEAAARDPQVACVAGIAPANLGLIADAFEADPASAKGFTGYADTMQMLAGMTGENAVAEIMANRDAFDTRLLAPRLAGKSVLIIGGDKDTSVPADTAIEPLVAAYEAAPDITLTARILSGDHSFSWSRDALIDEVLDWAEGCR
ncbi:alpha/beta hydrolase family protein [Hyphomonas johnsonii]|uniref:Putative lipoprotein n=1 Tax=Hyphomonas johnsonii MHS-2 TaxID=1280950 RepID=A0A059FTH4_9PROT|nr:alpha/beta fold hydrolase [Hyphomonas johnsonii]KCZ93758.1 putative lipoprotein [Hyphomonas johnsonii MHS-2]